MANVRKTRVYCCGAMRNKPHFAFPAFDAARDRLWRLGFDVVSPADIYRACGFDAMAMPEDSDWSKIPDGLDIDEVRARDIDALDTCDAVYVITADVDKSEGAQTEIRHARRTGKTYLLDTDTDKMLAAAALVVVDDAPADTAGEVRVTDPTTGGQKGDKLERHDLIPAEPLRQLAVHYGVGAKKYDDFNWARGYKWHLSFAACMRHLWAFWRGEDNDPETGSKHVICAAWHCLTMAYFMDYKRSHDDRHVPVESPA